MSRTREPWRRLSVIGDLCFATYLRQRARTATSARACSVCARQLRQAATARWAGGDARARGAPRGRAARARGRRAARRDAGQRALPDRLHRHQRAGADLRRCKARRQHRFLTDFRYATQSAAQVPDAFEREIVAGEMLEGVVEVLTSSRERGRASGLRRRKPHRQAARAPGRAARRGVGARSLRRRGRAAAGGQGRR